MTENLAPSAPGARPRASVLRSPWTVPAVVGVAVAAAFVAPSLASAGDADLPDVTPQELLASVAAAEPTPLSGTVVYTARLGLPELPITEATGADPLALLGGSSTLRVWTDGTERSRVALLGPTSEYSVVRDGAEAWTYSSSDDEVVHYALDAAGQAQYDAMAQAAREGTLPQVTGELPTPDEAAAQLLAHAEETSTVSLDAETTVAGRPAYQLVVTPRGGGTLVARVVVAVDAETSVPLRVQAWSTQDPQAPALEVGFTDLTFDQPADEVLAFSAPAGASVRDVVVPLPAQEELPQAGDLPTDPSQVAPPEGVEVTGEGWQTVVTLSDVDVAALVAGDPAALADAADPERLIGSDEAQELVDEFMSDKAGAMSMDLDTAALYGQLTTEVPEGRLLSSALLSILVTTDGRVLVGAVPADTLRAMA